MKLEGGCLCGNIRYVLEKQPIDAGFCHCSTCQRSSGAPTLAWLTIPVGSFNYRKGQVASYSSSASHQREFCPCCGTQIAFRKKINPQVIDVTLCSLDDSSAIAPHYHIWCQSKVSWLHLNDGLPQFPDQGPDLL